MPKSVVHSRLPLKHSWKQQLAQAISDPAELLELLQIDAGHFPAHENANRSFQVRVPRCYVNKMQIGNPCDPLLLQVMASASEDLAVDGFGTDPVGDLDAISVPGLLHKYQGRVLLITTGACAIHCRYCFRRHFPYSDNHSASNQWQQALGYIREDCSIQEVILSGGDPLVLSDSKLSELMSELQQIPHVKRLRIHSRLPVVLPDRITDELIHDLTSSQLSTCMVIHANHANEIGDPEKEALDKLHFAGVTLLNQAVLLKGVNDSVENQVTLCERLYEARVLPYYLHQLDPVAGAAHFNVDDAMARKIITEMRLQLPGYLIPTLVREIAGEKSKMPLFGL